MFIRVVFGTFCFLLSLGLLGGLAMGAVRFYRFGNELPLNYLLLFVSGFLLAMKAYFVLTKTTRIRKFAVGLSVVVLMAIAGVFHELKEISLAVAIGLFALLLLFSLFATWPGEKKIAS